MKMPRRGEFHNMADFLAAIDLWRAASNESYQYLRVLFDAVPPSPVKPDWLMNYNGNGGTQIRSVETADKPGSEDNLKCRLSMLASHSMECGLEPIRVCHGVFEENGQKIWACFAELH